MCEHSQGMPLIAFISREEMLPNGFNDSIKISDETWSCCGFAIAVSMSYCIDGKVVKRQNRLKRFPDVWEQDKVCLKLGWFYAIVFPISTLKTLLEST